MSSTYVLSLFSFLFSEDNLPLSDEGESSNRDNYASKSASAILMMVFQFSKDNTAIHK